MKQKVLAFFQAMPAEPYEQFNEAFALYRNSPAKNPSAERSYNASGYSPHMLESLLYDLQKAFDITDTERYTKLELRSEKEEGSQKLEVRSDGEVENKKLEVSDRDIDVLQLTEFQKDFSPIREEFPFLNDKDCPNELKILVADKITVWKQYEAIQEQIVILNAKEELTAEEKESLSELAKDAVAAFEENQAIYEELNAYNETGKVLGKHPIFRKLQMEREVEEMSTEELVKYKGSSAKYFTDNKKTLAKAVADKDEAKIKEINDRVAEREVKLALVNKKLGIQTK